MPSVSYEYNKQRILKWKADNADACRNINRLSMKRAYDRKKERNKNWLSICDIFSQILIDETIN